MLVAVAIKEGRMHYFVDKDDNDKEYQIQRCPFCGADVSEVMSQAELWEDNCFSIDVFTVCCVKDKGGCGATCGFHFTKQAAVSRWNTRVVI